MRRRGDRERGEGEPAYAGAGRGMQDPNLLGLALSASTNGIIITDPRLPDNPIVYVNPAFERITGYPAGEVIGKNCRFLQGGDREQPALEGLRAAIRDGREAHIVLRNYRKDGTLFWNELYVSPVRDGGELTHFIGVQNDVTERKLAEDTLRSDAGNLASIVEIQQEIATADLDLEMVMNLVAERMRHVTRADGGVVELVEGEELVYRAASGTVAAHVGLRLKISSSLSGRCVLGGEMLRSDDTEEDPRVDRKACRKIGARSMIVVPLHHEQRVVGVLKVLSRKVRAFTDRDVRTLQLMAGLIGAAMSHTAEFEARQTMLSERTAALARIRESEERFRTVFEGAAIGIALTDLSGAVVQSNPALRRILGYGEGELRGKSFTEVTYPDDVAGDAKLFKELVAGECDGYQMEKRYIHKDGHLVWSRLSVSLLRDPDGEPRFAIGMVEDVTESRRAEDEIRTRARQQAAVADLSRLALAQSDLKILMDEAVQVVSKTLEVEYCKVLELLPGGEELLLRAGVGWREGLVGRTTVGAHLDSQAGYTLFSDGPVISKDLSFETRFSGPPLLRGHGVVSGMSTVIRGYERPYGVLGAHTTRRRAFSEDDVNFLQAVANVLATAIERKRSEERVRFQSHLLDQVEAAVISTDLDGKVTYWNEHAERLYGYTREEALGRDITGLTVGPRETELAREIMEQLRSGKTWEGEFVTSRKDGSKFQAHVVDSLIYDSEGRAAGIVGVSTDISGRKEAESRLRESEERFRSAYEHAAIGMALISLDGRWLQVNRSLCEMLGYTEQELLAATSRDITHPGDLNTDIEYSRRLISGEIRSYQTEKRYFHKLGYVVWVRLSASLVRDADDKPLYGIAQIEDITERKRAEEALMEIRDAERRRIARDLHDLVLQDLVSLVQAMQAVQVTSGASQDRAYEEEVRILRRATKTMRETILDLHSEGRQPFVRTVESLVEHNRQMVQERELRLEVHEGFPEDLPERVSIELLRVVQEALVNVRRHSEADSVTVSLQARDREVCAEVYDDGRGFDPGINVDSVGLSSMKERIALLGGKLEVDSRPGRGTTVRASILLPDGTDAGQTGW